MGEQACRQCAGVERRQRQRMHTPGRHLCSTHSHLGRFRCQAAAAAAAAASLRRGRMGWHEMPMPAPLPQPRPHECRHRHRLQLAPLLAAVSVQVPGPSRRCLAGPGAIRSHRTTPLPPKQTLGGQSSLHNDHSELRFGGCGAAAAQGEQRYDIGRSSAQAGSSQVSQAQHSRSQQGCPAEVSTAPCILL